MEYIKLLMEATNLNPPSIILVPTGYSIRLFNNGDEYSWARIAYEADEFDSIDEALSYFNLHFTPNKSKLFTNCFFICDISETPIASATAWFAEYNKIEHGMVHWVIVSKSHQNKGLCRPLVTKVLQRLKEDYNYAFLTTQPYSFIGIKIYLDMGFLPIEEGIDWKKGWHLVWNSTHHPKLAKYSN